MSEIQNITTNLKRLFGNPNSETESKWAEFQSALDAYRDAAYWAGYKDAKDEMLESQVKK